MTEIMLEQTCGACPEQYEAYVGSSRVGFLRLRHGYFYVENSVGETIYEAHPRGDGMFEYEERDFYLSAAKNAIRVNLIESRIENQEIEFIREEGECENKAFFDVQVEGESLFDAWVSDGTLMVKESRGDDIVYSSLVDLDDEKDVALTLEIAKAGVRQWLVHQASQESGEEPSSSYGL